MKISKCRTYHITEDGTPLYPKRYDWVEDFYQGIAMVRKDGKWFSIDKQGKKVK